MDSEKHTRPKQRLHAKVATAVLVVVVAGLTGVPSPLRPAAAQRPPGTAPTSPAAPEVTGELLVQFEPSEPAAERSRVRARHRLTKVRDLPLPGLELVRFEPQAGAAGGASARALDVRSERSVLHAQPNFVYRPSAVIPNDPSFPTLWGLHNTGQSAGTVDADIDAPEAWEVTSGSSAVVVGVVDTGIDISQPDIAPNIWVNPGETAGNGLDDDANGYIDDVNGWDFFNDDNTVFDAVDGDEHGTHVAGTIAAVMDNASMVTGVSQARIMPLKFLGPNGGTTSDAILAIDYALAKGVKISNHSWGGSGLDQALANKVEAANAAGHLVVASAGNGGADGIGDNNDVTPSYPASFASANVIAVAATDRNDQLGSFSNFGVSTVDLGAPGVSIVSTVPPSTSAKAILTGPDTSPGTPYHAAVHTFGLEGVLAAADRTAVLGAALAWSGLATSAPVLVVDDDLGAAYQGTYTATLASLGYTAVTTHTVASPGCVNGPTAAQMAAYQAVVWFTGADFDCTLTSTDQTSLTTYLNGGGDLSLFGVDIGYDLTNAGSVANPFLKDKLRTRYVADADNRYEVLGVPGTPYSGVAQVELDANPASPTWQRYSSAVAALQGAVAGLKPTPPPGPVATYNGTSMASPHVSGALAQVVSSYPGITAAAAKARILNQGDAKPALSGKTVSGRRLNLAGALDTAGAPVISGVSAAPPSFPAGSGSTTLSWTLNEPSRVTVRVRPTATPASTVRTVALGARPAAARTWVWDGKDDLGNAVPAASYQLEVTAIDVTGATSTASATATATASGLAGRFTAVTPARALDTRSPAIGVCLPGPCGPVTNGAPMEVQITGRAGVPASGVSAVVMNVAVTEPTNASFVRVWPSDAPEPNASNLNFVAGQTVPNLVTVKLSPTGTVKMSVAFGTTHLVADVAGWYGDASAVTGARFNPVTPARNLDTRSPAIGVCLPGPCGPVTNGAPMEVQITGRAGVPASGVSAVVMNVAVTEPTNASFVRVWPSDAPEPNASNLNFVAGQTVPNLVTVKLSPTGTVKMSVAFGTTHLVADVAGWYGDASAVTGARFNPVTPARNLDTRSPAIGVCLPGPCGPVTNGAPMEVQITGRAGVPASGVSAVVMNVAVTEPTNASFVRVWPSDAPEPNASNLNFVAGQTVPNLVTVKLSPTGTVKMSVAFGTTHLVADVAGWYDTE